MRLVQRKPTPPAAPVTRTVSPNCSRARLNRAYQAVRYEYKIVDPTMRSNWPEDVWSSTLWRPDVFSKTTDQLSQLTRSPRPKRLGDRSSLPEDLQAREKPNG